MADELPVVIQKPSKRSRLSSQGEHSSLHQTYDRIIESAEIRQRQVNPEWRLDDICSQLPVTFDAAIHGKHESCYKNFNNVSKFENLGSSDLEEVEVRSSSRCPSVRDSPLLPSDSCLFCKKRRKTKNQVEEKLVQCLSPEASDSIHESCKLRNDYVLAGVIAGKDLCAAEAHYHPSCRKDYVRKPDRQHHSIAIREVDELLIGGTEHRRAADAAFQHVCSYITKHVLTDFKPEVVRMNMLLDIFQSHMLENAVEYYNPYYQMQKLKNRIIGQFGDNVKFYQPRHNASELLFKTNIDVGAAVGMMYEAASFEKMFHDAAVSIRRQILACQNKCSDMSWPPSVEYLESGIVAPPVTLVEFLQLVITGKTNKTGEKASIRTDRLSAAIAEDLCYASTRGIWKMPKHLLLAVSLHQLTGSAQIVVLLNRMGHCCSYTQLLDLETAMQIQVEARDPILPYNISATGNVVSNLCWDNFDMDEETVSGANTTHSTHGILIQELEPDSAVEITETYVPRRKKRT